MRSAEEKGCIYGSTEEVIPSSNATDFEFNPKGNRLNQRSHHRMALGKPTHPSKWDDAQKWLVGFSRGGGGGERSHMKTKPRNSNADDRRLIADVPHKEKDFCSSSDDEGVEDGNLQPQSMVQDEGETKNVDSNQTIWRNNRPSDDSYSSALGIRSICFRDTGTEMTPIASQEPSRTGTPIRDHMTPRARSPTISSRSSTLERCDHHQQGVLQISVVDESYQTGLTSFENRTTEAMHFGRDEGGATRWPNREEEELSAVKALENKNLEQAIARKSNPLETRAMAWDEAERAKYMARCKREEVKIQAWENHEKRKAEMKMRRMEVKAERLKTRAQEKLANKLAATRRIAEERRANAEAKLNEQAARTSERADYMRRTGHLPSSFSFKLPVSLLVKEGRTDS